MLCDEELAIESDCTASCCCVCRAESLLDSCSMLASTSLPTPELIESLRAETKVVCRSMREDIEQRGPTIQVSAEAGRLLGLLVRAAGATRVLELGTLFGYSGIWMARELPPGGRLDTVELNAMHADAAEHWFERAGLADRVTVHRGAGCHRRTTCPRRPGPPNPG